MDTIIVDHSMSEPFPIFMDIIFPFLECSYVSVDLADDSGYPIPVLGVDLRKHRINLSGQELSAAQTRAEAHNRQVADGKTPSDVAKVTELGKGYGTVQKDCMPCNDGGFTLRGEQCCDCNAVREYYRKRDELETYTTHALCIREHSAALVAAAREGGAELSTSEGCRVRGSLTVPRMRANLQVSANIPTLRQQGNRKSMLATLSEKFRIQHVIKELRFGEEFEGQAAPLAGVELYTPGLLRHIYLMKLVPTRYEGSWIPIESYQYSYAPHTEKVDTSKGQFHPPGVFFHYDFSPMMALISTRYSHLSTYITRIFALVGGLWVVLGVIYRVSNKVVAQVSKKKNE